MLSIKERIELNRRAALLNNEIKSGSLALKERIAKNRELSEVIAKVKETRSKSAENREVASGDQPEQQSELIKRFLAGDYNKAVPSLFVDVMRDVHADGLELEKIKSQVLIWFEANPEKIAA